MNIFQILAICGMLSPIVYTLMWILGGIIRSDYNHIRDDISSLFAVGAPRKRFFNSFIIGSSLLLFAFYLGLHWGINNGQGSFIGPILFVISGFFGVLVAIFFPLDVGGEIITLRGKMHLILVITSGILTIGGMIALWFRLESIEGWSLFANYSLISAIVSLILIIISGIFITSRFRGLLERFGVSPFQLYYFILGLMVLLTN
ncbi:DUF998 domain-containing protein [Candidatus Bathyarchaeota archaeon]|nr:DUF998 domain-containing protein [Candidatus Bathyarchaeota archaeon]